MWHKPDESLKTERQMLIIGMRFARKCVANYKLNRNERGVS